MTFWEQIIATFIGAFVAFVFSIALFYFTESWKNRRTKKDLCANLQKELAFNITFLEAYKDDVEKGLRQISADDKSVIIIFRFSKLQRLFVQEAFNKGLLYKYLTPEEITGLDSMLSLFTNIQDQVAINNLENYKNGKTDKAQTLRTFQYLTDRIKDDTKLCKGLKEKLKKL